MYRVCERWIHTFCSLPYGGVFVKIVTIDRFYWLNISHSWQKEEKLPQFAYTSPGLPRLQRQNPKIWLHVFRKNISESKRLHVSRDSQQASVRLHVCRPRWRRDFSIHKFLITTTASTPSVCCCVQAGPYTSFGRASFKQAVHPVGCECDAFFSAAKLSNRGDYRFHIFWFFLRFQLPNRYTSFERSRIAKNKNAGQDSLSCIFFVV